MKFIKISNCTTSTRYMQLAVMAKHTAAEASAPAASKETKAPLHAQIEIRSELGSTCRGIQLRWNLEWERSNSAQIETRVRIWVRGLM